MRSSAILSAWLWWRSGRLIEAARRAREAGHSRQAATLLDKAEAILHELRSRTHA